MRRGIACGAAAGTCTYLSNGCTDRAAYNYESSATQDDGTCKYKGCTDPTATNYDARATLLRGALRPRDAIARRRGGRDGGFGAWHWCV